MTNWTIMPRKGLGTYNVFALVASQVIWTCKAAVKSTHIGCNDKQSRNWRYTEDPGQRTFQVNLGTV
ncbi:hypothetical protein K435DRAFT_781309 [Dendrothele bispora CBS 962.96]|uniref:Uncharacterized protein n=1 Tax=Dendrothele bispora (strain CBS 962.96) TaxID=1314807 RepID=A0A4S8LLY0_DENBC|nr:hypothetical protein K435DRAFT_781309 [Dendrothele bispora CBS 962.96]